MDAILGWTSSDDEENEEMRERARREEMERRKREAEEYKMRIRKSEEEYFEPRRKVKKIEPVSLWNALESELVTVGDDQSRDDYKNMMSRIEKHFLGPQSEFKTELEKIDDFEVLKEFVFGRHYELRKVYQLDESNDEHIGMHNFLTKFGAKILRALTAVTKIGRLPKNEFEKNSRIFEEYWMKAHNLLLRDNQVRFRNIFELFNNYEKEKVDGMIEETRKQLYETLDLDDGVDELIGEMVKYTIKEEEEDEDHHVRETSPPPINRSFSDESIDILMRATSNMRIDCKSHRFESREEEEENAAASDSDDENTYIFKLLERDLTAPKINNIRLLGKVKIEEEDDFAMDIDHHGINVEHLTRRTAKKKVKFVDFESDLNKMRIFSHPLNWYRDDGDDGITLAYADMTLKEGWTYLRTMEPPYQLIRHSHYRQSYQQHYLETKSVNKLYKDLAHHHLPLKYEGTLGSRVWYTRENANDCATDMGLRETYDTRTLRQCIQAKTMQILSAFRKCYARELIVKRRAHPTSTIHRLALLRAEKWREPYEEVKQSVYNEFVEDTRKYYSQKVSSCFILSDWRLFSIHTSVFTNAETKYFPTHMGNAFFLALMQFLREFFSYDWIEIKTLVFAFGGHDSFELATIQRLLVYVQKLTANMDVQIHWISNCWVDSNIFDEINEKARKSQYIFHRMKSVNSGVEKFIAEMREMGFSNMHFYDICDLLRETEKTKWEDRIEYILNQYMQYFVEKCNVAPKSTYFEHVARNYSTGYLENEVKFCYNKSRATRKRVN